MASIPMVPAPARAAAEPVVRPPFEPGRSRAWLGRSALRIAVLLSLIGGGVLTYTWMFGKVAVAPATTAVVRGEVESTVVAGGVLQPIAYVDVGAQTSGKLKSLKVKRGDRVAQGQLLAEIDPALADTALASARAALENVTSQRAAKEAQRLLAELQEARNDRLFAERLISANDRDVTRASAHAAAAEVDAFGAQMKQAKAAVETAAANLGYAKITAPMAGEVVSISAFEGQTLNANQQAPNILRIADLSTVTVWAQVSEADVHRVKPGQEIYFNVLGRKKRWSGKVRQILPTPELINNVVFYDVLADIPNPERQLGIQMTAQVFIVLARATNALLVPTAVVGNASPGAKVEVQVLRADGTLEPRTIEMGIRSEIMAEVQRGLVEGDRVVLQMSKATPSARATTGSALTGRRGR